MAKSAASLLKDDNDFIIEALKSTGVESDDDDTVSYVVKKETTLVVTKSTASVSPKARQKSLAKKDPSLAPIPEKSSESLKQPAEEAKTKDGDNKEASKDALKPTSTIRVDSVKESLKSEKVKSESHEETIKPDSKSTIDSVKESLKEEKVKSESHEETIKPGSKSTIDSVKKSSKEESNEETIKLDSKSTLGSVKESLKSISQEKVIKPKSETLNKSKESTIKSSSIVKEDKDTSQTSSILTEDLVKQANEDYKQKQDSNLNVEEDKSLGKSELVNVEDLENLSDSDWETEEEDLVSETMPPQNAPKKNKSKVSYHPALGAGSEPHISKMSVTSSKNNPLREMSAISQKSNKSIPKKSTQSLKSSKKKMPIKKPSLIMDEYSRGPIKNEEAAEKPSRSVKGEAPEKTKPRLSSNKNQNQNFEQCVGQCSKCSNGEQKQCSKCKGNVCSNCNELVMAEVKCYSCFTDEDRPCSMYCRMGEVLDRNYNQRSQFQAYGCNVGAPVKCCCGQCSNVKKQCCCAARKPKTSCQPCSNSSGKCQRDDDEMFLQTFLPYVKCMNPEKKLKLRVEIQNYVYNFIYGDEPSSFNSKCEETSDDMIKRYSRQYVPSKPIQLQDEDEIFYYGLIPFFKELKPSKKILLRMQFMELLYSTLYNASTRVQVRSKKAFQTSSELCFNRHDTKKRRNWSTIADPNKTCCEAKDVVCNKCSNGYEEVCCCHKTSSPCCSINHNSCSSCCNNESCCDSDSQKYNNCCQAQYLLIQHNFINSECLNRCNPEKVKREIIETLHANNGISSIFQKWPAPRTQGDIGSFVPPPRSYTERPPRKIPPKKKTKKVEKKKIQEVPPDSGSELLKSIIEEQPFEDEVSYVVQVNDDVESNVSTIPGSIDDGSRMNSRISKMSSIQEEVVATPENVSVEEPVVVEETPAPSVRSVHEKIPSLPEKIPSIQEKIPSGSKKSIKNESKKSVQSVKEKIESIKTEPDKEPPMEVTATKVSVEKELPKVPQVPVESNLPKVEEQKNTDDLTLLFEEQKIAKPEPEILSAIVDLGPDPRFGSRPFRYNSKDNVDISRNPPYSSTYSEKKSYGAGYSVSSQGLPDYEPDYNDNRSYRETRIYTDNRSPRDRDRRDYYADDREYVDTVSRISKTSKGSKGSKGSKSRKYTTVREDNYYPSSRRDSEDDDEYYETTTTEYTTSGDAEDTESTATGKGTIVVEVNLGNATKSNVKSKSKISVVKPLMNSYSIKSDSSRKPTRSRRKEVISKTSRRNKMLKDSRNQSSKQSVRINVALQEQSSDSDLNL